MVSIKQDHEQDSLMVGVEDGIVAGISGTVVHGGGEQRPPTLQVEHPSYNDNFVVDGQQMISEQRMREILVELQQTWLKEYKLSREKMLVELTEKLHQEYLTDVQRKQTEFMAQYREEMEADRLRQEEAFQHRLQEEIERMTEKHRREIQLVKKKQWCWECEQEAIYHCCWNTAYCSVDCQQTHWPSHRRYCRRKKSAQGGGGGAGGGGQKGESNQNNVGAAANNTSNGMIK